MKPTLAAPARRHPMPADPAHDPCTSWHKPSRTAAFTATALAGLGALLGAPARAHGPADALPEDSRPRLEAAVAVSALSADTALPRSRWPGQPGSGTTPTDRRGLALEHATLGGAWRLPLPQGGEPGSAWSQGLRLVVGQHGSDRPHTEAAWWQGAFAPAGLALRLGRDRVALGEVVDGAGHFDRYAQPALAQRLVLDDLLIADGARLAWQPGDGAHGQTGLQALELGAWKIKAWPSSRAAPLAPSLRLQARVAGVDLSAFAASLRPRGRSMPLASRSAAHSHDQPDCRRSLTGLVCFDGRSRLLGLSARSQVLGLDLSGAALALHDRGDLYSARGAADYAGRQHGAWLELGRRLAPRWHAGTRLERSVARHRLTGPGADLLAEDAGLLDNQPIQRLAAELDWTPAAAWNLSAETGREARRGQPANRWIGLRLRWTQTDLLGGF